MRVKKIPQRKCVACGESKPKQELIRVVRNKELVVTVDQTGKVNGRGAYICSNLQCLELAEKSKKLNRALEASVSEEIYQSLRDTIELKKEK